ncbi:MAG: hypothetical protein DRO40_06615 [Thermoprotei archaeon]|nr:MAG: hypothetical protein DRO40_06615 [Thermoprotei archaeon]
MPKPMSMSPKSYYILLLLNKLAYTYSIEEKIDVLKSLVSFVITYIENTRRKDMRKDYTDLANILDMLNELEARLMVFRSLVNYYDREILLGNIYDVPKDIVEYCRIKGQIKLMEAKVISKLGNILGEQIPITVVKPPFEK